MNIENYRAVRVCDSQDNDVVYAIIMLNNKHSVQDLQKEFSKILKENYEYIYEYGNDVEFIKEHISSELDWFELPTDTDYVEV